MWGWPLVNGTNRAAAATKVPEPGLIGGMMPITTSGGRTAGGGFKRGDVDETAMVDVPDAGAAQGGARQGRYVDRE